jgi:hypothetical protein
MITDMNARVAMAQKLSIPQLQQAIKNGTVPAYVGVPLLQDKMRQQQQMAMAQQGQQQQQPPIAEQIMAEASRGGVDQLPSNLPIQNEEDEEGYAGGGIIAFAGDSGSLVRRTPQYSSEPKDDAESLTENNLLRNRLQRVIDQAAADAAARGQPISKYNFNESIDRALGESIATPRPSIPSVSPRRISEAEAAQANMLTAEAASPGVTGLPNAQNVQIEPNQPPDGQRGAALTGAGSTPRAATPATAETAPAPKSALDQYADMLMEERKGIAKDRQQAKAMALLQTGLGIAGGTSPNPFANIAQGALQGTQAYQQEMRGIRKEDADRLKQLMSLGIGKEKLALEAKKLGITEKRFDQMYDLETAKLGVMGGQRADSRAQAEELRRLSVAQGLFSTLRKDQLMSGLSDEELWSRAQRMAGQAGTTPVASSGSTVMGSYVPGKGYIPNK